MASIPWRTAHHDRPRHGGREGLGMPDAGRARRPWDRSRRTTAPTAPASRNPSMAAATSGCRDDARLQVVEHRVAEELDVAGLERGDQHAGVGAGRRIRVPPCVCLGGAHVGKERFSTHHVGAGARVRAGPSAAREHGLAGEHGRHVRAEPEADSGDVVPRRRGMPELTQGVQRRGGVGAASREPRRDRHPLVEGDRDRRRNAEARGEPGPLARRGSARRVPSSAARSPVTSRTGRTLDASDRDHVVERDREHERLDVVEPVLARAEHPQEDVDLRVSPARDLGWCHITIRSATAANVARSSSSGLAVDSTPQAASAASAASVLEPEPSERVAHRLPTFGERLVDDAPEPTPSTATGGEAKRSSRTTTESTAGRGQNTDEDTRRTIDADAR